MAMAHRASQSSASSALTDSTMAETMSLDVDIKDKADSAHVSHAESAAHSSETGEVAAAMIVQKPFTTLSAMSMGYSITNTGLGFVLIVSNTVFGAGPLFIYGTLLIACITFCVAITLGELTSAYPHAGGQYFWTAQLAPEWNRRFLSYMTAIISWASVICIGASGAAGATNTTFAVISLTRPDFEYKQWMGFLVYQGYTWTAAVMVVCERALPRMSKFFLYWSVITMTVLFVVLLASKHEKQSAAVVFGADGYFNTSGWPDGFAFLVGISGINWGFSCLDALPISSRRYPTRAKTYQRRCSTRLSWASPTAF